MIFLVHVLTIILIFISYVQKMQDNTKFGLMQNR